MSNNVPPVLYVIVPCYNEDEVLPITSDLFLGELKSMISDNYISADSRLLFVDDGSGDKTWDIICDLTQKDKCCIGLSQSRNRGHQNALYAGLMESKEYCDIAISIDCDGQDDVSVMREMVSAYREGYDVVYGVRNRRKTDSFGKKISAGIFYGLLACLGVEITRNHADYRLLSSKAIEALSGFSETNLFLRGLIPLVGFESTCVYYDRKERLAGKTHYSLGKMMGLAVDGVTSFSVKPIRLITLFGFFVALLSFIGIIWTVVGSLNKTTVDGWSSIICVICFVSGIQLLSLGIIGEYVGKIYLEVKKRPRYIIDKKIGIWK